MTALVGISCDGCEVTLTLTTIHQVSTTTVRDEAKARGWHKTRGKATLQNGRQIGYARDVCPTCWDKGVR